jgi:hypothetical protein
VPARPMYSSSVGADGEAAAMSAAPARARRTLRRRVSRGRWETGGGGWRWWRFEVGGRAGGGRRETEDNGIVWPPVALDDFVTTHDSGLGKTYENGDTCTMISYVIFLSSEKRSTNAEVHAHAYTLSL